MTSTITTANSVDNITESSTDSRHAVGYRAVLRATGVATLAAAAATEAFVGTVRACGVHVAAGSIGGSSADVVPIGPGACSIMVVIAVVLGTVLALALQRFAGHPAATYRRAACALTVVSFVPDLFAGATTASSKIVLMTAHVIAAAIVVPLVSRALRD